MADSRRSALGRGPRKLTAYMLDYGGYLVPVTPPAPFRPF